MSASTFTNKFYLFSLGLSLLSAIPFGIASLYALYLPQSVQAISFAPTQEPSLRSEAETPTLNRDGISRDRTIPTSELPAVVTSIVFLRESFAFPIFSKTLVSIDRTYAKLQHKL